MAKFPTRTAKSVIMLRCDSAFKKRFDSACEIKGWKLQTALEKILGQWLEDFENEQQSGAGGKNAKEEPQHVPVRRREDKDILHHPALRPPKEVDLGRQAPKL